MSSPVTVLVTGATGYVGAHVVKQLLASTTQRYIVRGTVRDLENKQKIQPLLDSLECGGRKLDLVEADLKNPESWRKAVEGCQFVHHIESPYMVKAPKNQSAILQPAIDGTLNVLKACTEACSVKKVVLTSSCVAILGNYNRYVEGQVFTETNWTDPDSRHVSTYVKSKTLTEQTAWQYWQALPENDRFEMVSINPGLILGPCLIGTTSTSQYVLKNLLENRYPLIPKVMWPVVDVRDVAAAHIAAMTAPHTSGHRYIVTAKNVWLREIAEILREEFEVQGYKIPTMCTPNWLLRLGNLFTPLKDVLPMCGTATYADNSRMRIDLQLHPRELRSTVLSMAYNLIEDGKIMKAPKYKPKPLHEIDSCGHSTYEIPHINNEKPKVA